MSMTKPIRATIAQALTILQAELDTIDARKPKPPPFVPLTMKQLLGAEALPEDFGWREYERYIASVDWKRYRRINRWLKRARQQLLPS